MQEKVKWTIYQIIALIIFVIGLSLFHHFMDFKTVQPNDMSSMFAIGGVLYIPISWIYIMIYLEQRKKPKLMEHRIWRRLPILLIGVGIISLIILIILLSIDSSNRWIEQSQWVFYVLISYASILYYIFIMSIVYKLIDSKHHVVHYSYVWALGIIFAIIFLF